MNQKANSTAIIIEPGKIELVGQVHGFLHPFMEQNFLLPRTEDELISLLNYSFVASLEHDVVGFAAVEIYSKKLAEIQCLAVSPTVQRQGVGRKLVQSCVEIARQQGVKELMAISSTEEMFVACGFHYSLPNQKRALFISPQETDE